MAMKKVSHSIGSSWSKSACGVSGRSFIITNQFFAVARILMSHGATLDHEDVDGDTPYTLAFNKGHRNLVTLIEEENTRRATAAADKPVVEDRKASTISLKKWKTR